MYGRFAVYRPFCCCHKRFKGEVSKAAENCQNIVMDKKKNDTERTSRNTAKAGKSAGRTSRKKTAEKKVIALPGAETGATAKKRRNPLFEKITSETSLIQIRGWCMEGAINQEIADRLGISEATLYRYQQQSEELRSAMASGKEIVDYRVENALLQRALGYEYTEIVTERDGPSVKVKIYKKQMPPDVTAGIFWLRNRKADRWKQKPEYIPEDNGTGVVVMPEIMEELEAVEKEAAGSNNAGDEEQEAAEST